MPSRPYRGVPSREREPYLWRGWNNLPRHDDMAEAMKAKFAAPFVGITADGTVLPDLFPLAPTAASTKKLVDAARGFVASLEPEQRKEIVHPIDSPGWREWTNGFPRWTPHGKLLADLSEPQRELALALLAESFSATGFEQVRNIMKLNEALGELLDAFHDTLNQWIYFFTIFGDPSSDEPWGWQLMGHHLDLHCFILGDQVVMTPAFLGAEFCEVDDGPFAGIRVFERERSTALAFVNSFTSDQLDTAVLYHSILSKDLPPEFSHPADGRMRAGAGADNNVIPYEGLPATRLSDDQRHLFEELLDTFVGSIRAPHQPARRAELLGHLDDTYFAWIGGTGIDDPFYYKIQSPVILVEYDCHKGVFLAADEPLPFHVHTVVRTPNGNDYGKDLLRQHYERFTH